MFNEDNEDNEHVSTTELQEIIDDFMEDVIEASTLSIQIIRQKENLKKLFLCYYHYKYTAVEEVISTFFKVKSKLSLNKDKRKKALLKKATINFENNEISNYNQIKAEILLKDVIMNVSKKVLIENMKYLNIIIKLQSAYRGRIARILYKIKKMNYEFQKEEEKFFKKSKNKKVLSIMKKLIKIPNIDKSQIEKGKLNNQDVNIDDNEQEKENKFSFRKLFSFS